MADNSNSFYAKIWCTIMNDSWFQGLSGTERGLWLQLIIICRRDGDSGGIFRRNFPVLAAETGLDRKTCGKNLRKFHNDGKIKLTETDKFIKIEVVNYMHHQHIRNTSKGKTVEKSGKNRGKFPLRRGEDINDMKGNDTKPKINIKSNKEAKYYYLNNFNQWVKTNHDKIIEMAEAGKYPLPWVHEEIEKMRVWIIGNPSGAPKKLFGKFISSWLMRSRKWALEPKNPISKAQEDNHYADHRRSGTSSDFTSTGDIVNKIVKENIND